MKKLTIFSLLLCAFLFFNPCVFANDSLDAILNEEKIIDKNNSIHKEIKNLIVEIYGAKDAEEIYQNVILLAQKAISQRSEILLEQDRTRDNFWYKNEIIYMFYVDQFGVIRDDKKNTFKDTENMLDYLQDLGVTTLYMLPFADSPMKDVGFDVKNPKSIRRELGTTGEFKEFVGEAKKRGFKIKADLVLNHFSDEHEWFKKLQEGDLDYLDYFIYTKNEPQYKKYQDEKLGTVIEYAEPDGKISKRRLIFPENTENNYRKVNIKGVDYYFYHTFYPFQLDINWQNPKVLYYVLETITYWANLGVDIFRMDAIPYLSKESGTNAENLPKTHAIVKLISNYIQLSAPSSVIQVEACQTPKDILAYFGHDREVKLEIADKNTKQDSKAPIQKLTRTDEAQIAYHFPYMPALWATLITSDKKYFIDAYKKTPSIPKSAAWGIFLRVHDELTLEMVSPEVRNLVFENLVSKGAGFRNGFGVSGRMANFLDKNPDRIEQAFSILFSLPGIPIIYYGDEVGAVNNFENAKKAALQRQKGKFKNLLSSFDSRDIHRGNIAKKLFYGSSLGYYKFNSKVYKKVKNLIAVRKRLPAMVNGSFEILKTKSKSNFAYIRKNRTQEILVINNLSNEKLTAEITMPYSVLAKNNGKITNLKNLINNTNIKVNLSMQNKTMHLRLAPYQSLWLEL